MLTFYIDGQSIGNEKAGSVRRAKLAIAFRPETSTRNMNPARIVVEDIGDRTNNEAEYDALLRLLKLLDQHMLSQGTQTKLADIQINSDSEVLVNQLNGTYQVREERLRRLWNEAKALMRKIGTVRVDKVPREENLAGLWLERKIEGKQVRPEEFLSGI